MSQIQGDEPKKNENKPETEIAKENPKDELKTVDDNDLLDEPITDKQNFGALKLEDSPALSDERELKQPLDPKDINFTTEEYEKCIAEARETNFERLEALQLALEGTDNDGRPTFVVIGPRLPKLSGKVETRELLLFFLRKLEPIVQTMYTFVYIHSKETTTPPFTFFTEMYKILPRKHKKNLASFCIVRPSFVIRALMRFVKTFVSSKVWRKTTQFESGFVLREFLGPKVDLPLEVYSEADFEENPFFGVTLEYNLGHVLNKGKQIPYFFEPAAEKIRKSISTEGLFRISGSFATLGLYKKLIASGKPFSFENEDVHIACGLIKFYLNKLPEPLIPFSTGELIIEAFNKNETIDCPEIHDLLKTIPETNKNVLNFFVDLLGDVLIHSNENKMGLSAISTIAAPIILRLASSSPADQLKAVQPSGNLAAFLITRLEKVSEKGFKYEPNAVNLGQTSNALKVEEFEKQSFVETEPEESLIETEPKESLVETNPEESLIETEPKESSIETEPKETE